MRRRCTAVLNAAGGHTQILTVTFDFEPPFVQGHIIPFVSHMSVELVQVVCC
jgi:hypothetical protein